MRRYTFEKTDFFVDKDPEYKSRSARDERERREDNKFDNQAD